MDLILVLLLLAQDNPNPGLPRVLLIGDSISMGYEAPVRKLLESKAEVRRIPANGGTSANGVFMAESWLGKEKWDVIHFNFGLHDLKRLDDGEPQVPLEAYKRYLRLFTQRLKQTNATLIFATTTPVPEGKVSPPRQPADVVLYNEAAVKIMQAEGVSINDLFGFAQPRLATIQRPVNVHFSYEGSGQLGAQVANAILQSIKK